MTGLAGELQHALPQLARAMDGWMLVADAGGVVLCAFDPKGVRAARHEGVTLFTSRPAAPERVACPWNTSVEFLVVPVGDVFLCLDCGGSGRRIRRRFERALPLIARVAGGEAVLFDRFGTRGMSVDSDGNTNADYVGQTSSLARQSMEADKPVIGDSTYIVGAKAVRIPVTEDFGIGFNNNDSVAQRQKLIDSIYDLQTASATFADIVGGSGEMERVKREARDAASADGPALVTGGRGTGKRMFAEAMHNAGPRRTRPFVTVNCGAFDQDLLEGALFGYADAVIRGVRRGRHPGAIVLAGGGTLYLVNVDQMELGLQEKLRRALAEGKFSAVGDDAPIEMNVAVIASTDKNLAAMVKVGRFEPELYGILSKNLIALPPLAKIPEIIPGLVEAFLGQLNLHYGTRVEAVDDEVMDILERQPWPGNARDLRVFLQTILAGMDDSDIIRKRNLPLGLLGQAPAAPADGDEDDTVYGMLVRDYEAQILRHALLVNDGSRLKTAEQLGLSKSSLWRKMKKLNIE